MVKGLKALNCEYKNEFKSTHDMYRYTVYDNTWEVWGGVSFTLPHPPEDTKKSKKSHSVDTPKFMLGQEPRHPV